MSSSVIFSNLQNQLAYPSAIVDGGWSAYGPWGPCSVTCGAGIRQRLRTCTNPAPARGGAYCVGSATNTQTCYEQPCSSKPDISVYGKNI